MIYKLIISNNQNGDLNFIHNLHSCKTLKLALLFNESHRVTLETTVALCSIYGGIKTPVRVNVIFRDLNKKNSSFLTDRKLEEMSPEATAFCFGTIKPWRQDGLCERWHLPAGPLSAAETARWYLKVSKYERMLQLQKPIVQSRCWMAHFKLRARISQTKHLQASKFESRCFKFALLSKRNWRWAGRNPTLQSAGTHWPRDHEHVPLVNQWTLTGA